MRHRNLDEELIWWAFPQNWCQIKENFKPTRTQIKFAKSIYQQTFFSDAAKFNQWSLKIDKDKISSSWLSFTKVRSQQQEVKHKIRSEKKPNIEHRTKDLGNWIRESYNLPTVYFNISIFQCKIYFKLTKMMSKTCIRCRLVVGLINVSPKSSFWKNNFLLFILKYWDNKSGEENDSIK